MDYDVLILGGGIIGCSVAYELSKYNFNIALIERGYDIVDDISFVNTAVIYDGSESSNDTTALLEKEGSELIRDACKQFNVECNKVGALRIAKDISEEEIIDKMYNLAIKRGIEKVRLIEPSEVYNLEEALRDIKVTKALYSENVSVINPYDLAIAYGEVAEDNGVNLGFKKKF
jgi:L-2-hydroxyglutarate oxidase LhgO